MGTRAPNAIRPAERLAQMPPYLFVDIADRKRRALDEGRDLIDFGIGDPDQPTPAFIIDHMARAVRHPPNHRYGDSKGSTAFRAAAAAFLQRRFGVAVDSDEEVVALLGTKEGIAHLPTAVVNPGDVVLVPEPGYPAYASGAVLAGGVVHCMPLSAASGWLPRIDGIPADVCRRASLMYLNYPNNPTAACAPLAFFEEIVDFADNYGVIIAQDAAYSELFFDDPPPSILQVNGARETCIEFHSLSKTFNMTGWRAGFAAGNRDVLAALAKVKSTCDSGIFRAIEDTAICALRGRERTDVRRQVDLYRSRRDALVGGLTDCGWLVESPRATFFVWAKCPHEVPSLVAAHRLLDEADVVTIPGSAFGSSGEGYIRFADTVSEDRIHEAIQRIRRIVW